LLFSFVLGLKKLAENKEKCVASDLGSRWGLRDKRGWEREKEKYGLGAGVFIFLSWFLVGGVSRKAR
jgi:hypothetical protein